MKRTAMAMTRAYVEDPVYDAVRCPKCAGVGGFGAILAGTWRICGLCRGSGSRRAADAAAYILKRLPAPEAE